MKNMISKLILLTIPIFIFIIWLVMHNQHKVNHIVKTQTTQFNKQFTGFNKQFGSASPRKAIKKHNTIQNIVKNNKQLNNNISNAVNKF